MGKNNSGNNTFVELEMADGSKVRMTLAFIHLNSLSAKNRDAYAAYNESWRKKEHKRDEFDNIRFLFTGYLCAAIADGTYDEAMSWNQFIEKLPVDREVIGKALMGLIAPNRKGDSAKRSE